MNTKTKTYAWKSEPASVKQSFLITQLLKDKDLVGYEDFVTKCSSKIEAGMTKGDASEALSWLLKRPAVVGLMSEPGYYVTGEGETATVYHVVMNKAKTATYAYVLVITKPLYEGGKTTAKWVYAPGKGRDLAAEGLSPLTAVEAAALGHLHGVCVVCAKQLTVPKSVEAGIGPVCIKKLGG